MSQVPQDPDFVFKHDSMDGASTAWVMTVVVRVVAPWPKTWREWLAHSSPLDTHYGLPVPEVRSMVGQYLDYVLRCTYDEEDDPGATVRVLLHRTHFAAHVSFAYINAVLINTWLSDMARSEMLTYLRAVLLSRMLITWDWTSHVSELPDFKPQKIVLVSGIRAWC